ncbi:MAG: hypothetical protein GXP58_08695 [Deltaproteobacteria bacterium]|nr:hypothetical protein [Deltaproteobacteria bacterium]
MDQNNENETVIGLLPLDLPHLSQGALRMLAADPGVDPVLLKEILVLGKEDPDTVRCLIRNPALPDSAFEKVMEDLNEELRQEVAFRGKSLALYEEGSLPSTERAKKQRGVKGADGKKSMQARIQQLTMGDKLAYALKGPKEARTILVRDPNREIALTVVKNPKITEGEVELFAASTNVCEDVHREIGKNREWCKKYTILRALVFNPKTPVGISLEKLPYIKEKDLQFLCKSKNVPNAISGGAKRLLAQKRKKH